MNLLLAMSAIVATWIVLGVAQIGLGLTLQRMAGLKRVGGDRLLLAFWMGYAALIGLLQVWHLFLPITWHVLVVMISLGAAGLLWCGPAGLSRLVLAVRRRRGLAIVIAAAGLWTANQALGPGDAHDSGRFHYQVIRWINEHRLVAGIANLDPAYALNTGNLLHVAAVNTGPWAGRAEHVANGLLLWALLAHALVSLARLARRRGKTLSNVYGAVLLVPAVMLLFSKEVSSPKTDLAANVLLYVVGWILLAVLEPDERQSRRDRLYKTVALATLCALAPCLKLSTAFFVVSVWGVALAVWVVRQRREPVMRDWGVLWAVVLSALLVGPWMARNVVTSGYPMFPAGSAVSVPVDWRLPGKNLEWYQYRLQVHPRAHMTLWMAETLRDSPLSWYGRLMTPPYDDVRKIQGVEWVPTWLIGLPASSLVEVVIPTVVTLAAWGAVFMRRRRAGPAAARIGPAGWLMPVCFVAMICWLVFMPGPRYAYGVTWVMAAVSMAIALRMRSSDPPRPVAAITIVAVVVMLVPTIAYRMCLLYVLRDGNPFAQIPFRGPGPDQGFHPYPRVEWQSVTTRWGLELHVPVSGTKCWDCPVPCVGSGADLNLRLRHDGDLSSGFVSDRWGVFGGD